MERRPVINLDKMWMNAHDGKDKECEEKNIVTEGTLGGVKKPPGKGMHFWGDIPKQHLLTIGMVSLE